jgi:hypothetical protein
VCLEADKTASRHKISTDLQRKGRSKTPKNGPKKDSSLRNRTFSAACKGHLYFRLIQGPEEAAEKVHLLRRNREKRPSAAKAALIMEALCGG